MAGKSGHRSHTLCSCRSWLSFKQEAMGHSGPRFISLVLIIHWDIPGSHWLPGDTALWVEAQAVSVCPTGSGPMGLMLMTLD